MRENEVLENERFVSDKVAAKILGMRPITLRKWRASGKGPRYMKFGKAVRYRIKDVQAWAENHVVVHRKNRENK